jgi:hypothetical protein
LVRDVNDVVIPDLVSDRRERRVSGIHASAAKKQSRWRTELCKKRTMQRCVNAIAVLHGERMTAAR